jgi:hypothetical protein
LCFHWCAAQLRLSCCNSLCVSCSSLNSNWVIKEVPCWQAFWSYSILAFMPLSCNSHPNARNLWNHSWARHCMIWLGFSRWLYPLLSWCGKIPFSDQQLRQDLNWKFIFFALMLIIEAWGYMELADSDLKLRFCFWSGFSNGSLEQWRFQILTLLVKLLPNAEIEMAAVIIEYVRMSLVVTLVEVCRVCHSSCGLQIW